MTEWKIQWERKSKTKNMPSIAQNNNSTFKTLYERVKKIFIGNLYILRQRQFRLTRP